MTMAAQEPENGSSEAKWKANQEKVAFMKQFPGLTTDWKQTQGKTISLAASLPSKPGAAVVVFTDGTFVVAPPPAPEPRDLGEGLQAARPALEPVHATAYREYDRLVEKDNTASKAARLEKILSAIHNNLERIPDLKDRIKELVKQWK
jgi:hypothetical protein